MSVIDRFKIAATAIVLCFGLCPASALAMEPMQPVDIHGAEFLSGGIGKYERADLLERASHYDLVISFARASDGAYLGEAEVTLKREGARAPIELTTEGPLLLARLPAGSYELSAEVDGWKPIHRDVTIDKDHSQKAIYLTFQPTNND